MQNLLIETGEYIYLTKEQLQEIMPYSDFIYDCIFFVIEKNNGDAFIGHMFRDDTKFDILNLLNKYDIKNNIKSVYAFQGDKTKEEDGHKIHDNILAAYNNNVEKLTTIIKDIGYNNNFAITILPKRRVSYLNNKFNDDWVDITNDADKTNLNIHKPLEANKKTNFI
jgi:hypothetical protein